MWCVGVEGKFVVVLCCVQKKMNNLMSEKFETTVAKVARLQTVLDLESVGCRSRRGFSISNAANYFSSRPLLGV